MIGDTISHYLVTEKLGEGAMGEVYQARDPRLNRTVAIKVLSAQAMSDPDRRRRFILEAQAASSLNHPNIITIHDIVTDSNTEYMVMEYVAGKTLADLIPTGGVGVEKALRYGVQIADALAAAHAAGIVHRDLKPGNIMVTDSGLLKILDFGLAKMTLPVQVDAETQPLAPLTVEGAIHGTLSYMSPEQAQGSKIDARSDIFSFGALMYEVVTGRKAFNGPSLLAVLTAVLRDPVPPIRDSVADCPPELEEVIARAMRKDPAERWQSMREVHGVLRGLRQKFESGILHQAKQAAPEKKWGRVLTLGLIAAVVVVVAAGVGGWLSVRKTRTGAPSPAVAVQSSPAPVPVPAAANPTPPAVPAALASDKPSPLAAAPKPDANGVLTNQSVLQLADAHMPESDIVGHIRASKTKFDLSPAGISQLNQAGVTAAVIEAMRHPLGMPRLPPAAPALSATGHTVYLIGGNPFDITLLDEVPINPAPGKALRFQAAKDVVVEGDVAIAKGAPVTGLILSPGKKNFIGRGGKPTFSLVDVLAVDGSKVKVKAAAGRKSIKNESNIEPPGRQDEKSPAPARTYKAYFDGDQPVTVKK